MPDSFRTHIPHFNVPSALQFVTYRLADGLPKAVIAEIEAELRLLPHPLRIDQRQAKTNEAIDRGYGSRVLQNEIAAGCVIENWRFHDPTHYRLHAYVVMPTHVHVLLLVGRTRSLGSIVQKWKTYTGSVLGPLYPDTKVDNSFWGADYFDRYIRDEAHLRATIEYIRQNPVRAGLVDQAVDWPYVWVDPLYDMASHTE